jgi:hypothetical protein
MEGIRVGELPNPQQIPGWQCGVNQDQVKRNGTAVADMAASVVGAFPPIGRGWVLVESLSQRLAQILFVVGLGWECFHGVLSFPVS